MRRAPKHEQERDADAIADAYFSGCAELEQTARERSPPTVERALIRQVKDQENAHGAAVVGRRDGAEALLSCRVPLQEKACRHPVLSVPPARACADGRPVGLCPQSGA